MTGLHWPDGQLALLGQYEDYAEFAAASEAMGYPARTVKGVRMKRDEMLGPVRTRYREALRAMTEPDGAVVGHQTVTLPATPEEWEDYFASLADADEQGRTLGTTQPSTDWHAPDDDLPVGVLFSGDWHGGAKGVLYRQLDRDLDILRQTPGLYGIMMGDAHEGVSIHSKAAPALYGGLFNSGDEQEMWVRLRLKRAMPKWLAILSGNHDEWVYKHAGITRMPKMAAELEVPHFGEGGGTVFAHVGNYRYALGVQHNHAGNSRLNTSNSQRRMFDDWPSWENLHVATIAHFHYCDLHTQSRKGGRCIYLRCGTYKVHDAYAKAGGFTPEYGVPLVVLLPDIEKAIPFRGDDFEYGLKFLAMIREEYRSARGHNSFAQTSQIA